jgi:phosphoglycolate phosphatase-like HAD superfamily hydrolase
LRATPGARALVEHMLARGLELVVAPSAKSDEVRALLEQAGVSDLIRRTARCLATRRMTWKPRPSPLGEGFSRFPR